MTIRGETLLILTIVFIVLKLTGVVTWPWIWVLAPFWIPWAVAIGVGGFVLLLLSRRKI